MNRKLGRYCKSVVAFICSLVIFFGGIYLTSFHSRAETQDTGANFYVHYPKPPVSNTQGYVNLLCVNQNGYYVETILWNLYGTANDGSYAPISALITLNSGSWKFGGIADANTTRSFYYSLYMFDSNGVFSHLKTSDSEGFTRSVNGQICGYMAFGNVSIVESTSFKWPLFTVYYTEDATVKVLYEVLNTLYSMNSREPAILSAVNSILNSVDGVENQLSSVINYLKSIDSELDSIKSELQDIYDKAEEILQEEKKQTTWLEKIWNSIQDFLGMQGEESTEALPDEEVDSVLKDEDNLMQDTTDAENSLDFSVDSNSNNVVWNVIERVLNANPRVFGAFIGIMTLGVITLLLNR